MWIEIDRDVWLAFLEDVTPCAGVWIEIVFCFLLLLLVLSLPVRECGLKLSLHHSNICCVKVTPCAGVWIEIDKTAVMSLSFVVTPCAGVWIEIYNVWHNFVRYASLPVRECGLKSRICVRLR